MSARGCTETECTRKHYGRDLCHYHWQQIYNAERKANGHKRAPTSRARLSAKYVRDRLRNTGFTPEQFGQQFTTQGGKCALCGEAFDDTRGGKAVADHCHVTGRRRGILHSRCNLAVGQYEKYAERCKSYLEKFSDQ